MASDSKRNVFLALLLTTKEWSAECIACRRRVVLLLQYVRHPGTRCSTCSDTPGLSGPLCYSPASTMQHVFGLVLSRIIKRGKKGRLKAWPLFRFGTDYLFINRKHLLTLCFSSNSLSLANSGSNSSRVALMRLADIHYQG